MSLPNIPKVLQKVRPRYPKRLVIIRHGQSEQNAALDLMGRILHKEFSENRP